MRQSNLGVNASIAHSGQVGSLWLVWWAIYTLQPMASTNHKLPQLQDPECFKASENCSSVSGL